MVCGHGQPFLSEDGNFKSAAGNRAGLRVRDSPGNHLRELDLRMQILAISGSLRAASTNTNLLKAAANLAPEDVNLVVYDGLGEIPPFNPDLDTCSPSGAVTEFRAQLRNSAAVIFSTPEYAHGVPGVLKNALDWIVASGELYKKPVAIFSASHRGGYAQASLVETLTVMTANLVPEACVVAPLVERNLDKTIAIADPVFSNTLRLALQRLRRAIISL